MTIATVPTPSVRGADTCLTERLRLSSEMRTVVAHLREGIEDPHQERDVAEHGDRDDALLEIEERSDAIVDRGHEHDREEPARDAEAHEEVGLHEPPPVAVEPPRDRSDGEHDQQESYRLYTSPWFPPRHDGIPLELNFAAIS
jgi:hypothetical protein